MPCDMVKIISNTQIARGIYSMRVPFSEKPRAGQFFMLRSETPATLLPRPISVCDWENGVLTFLYAVVGKGTAELSRLGAGECVQLTGPLGNGFPLEEPRGKIALVGGGIGVAPLLLTARELNSRGLAADCFAGFRDEVYLCDELSQVCGRLDISTESGAHGHKGFVTELLDPKKYDAVFCCGPTPMMKAVTELCVKEGTPVYISLENKMACGIGACLVCTCADKSGKNRRTCADGPVFRGEDINFDA